jgi:hypothetical protein
MNAQAKDNIVTIAAIGVLAYASADIVHHVLGHGAACLAFGGQIISLSSTYVRCSLYGSAIDLAGPFANLVIGLVAMLAAHMVTRASPPTRLLYILVSAFNLLWFALQLAFSAATNTDDWAWAMHHFRGAQLLRYCMVAVGALGYLLAVRVIAIQMAPFAHPRARSWKIALTAWLSAGAIACATAAFDHNAGATLFRHVLEQSLGLSVGLLFVPTRAARVASPDSVQNVLTFSIPWAVTAAIVGAASILFLGPGVAIAI